MHNSTKSDTERSSAPSDGGGGSDGQVDRRLGHVVALLVGRYALVVAHGPGQTSRRTDGIRKMLAALLFKSRLKQVPVFHPDDDRPGTSTEGASRRRAAGHGKCGRESFFCRRVVCATGRGRPSC